MEQHRANPACASCHKIMDPIGFALENFDHAGKWRTIDGADADRRDGPAGGRHQARRLRLAAPRAARARRRVCRRGGREAADLRHRAGRCGRRTCRAVRAVTHGAAAGQLSLLVARARRRAARRSSRCAPRPTPVRSEPSRRRRCSSRRSTCRAAPFLRGLGASVALPLLDSMVAAQTPLRAPRRAEDPLCRLLRAARRDDGQVDAGGRRHRLRVHRDPQAARAVPRSHDHRQRPGASLRRRRRRRRRLGRRQPHARGGGVPHRLGAAAGPAGASRRLGRPGGGAAHRAGHAAAVAGAVDRGGGARAARRASAAPIATRSRGSRPSQPLPMQNNPRLVFEKLFGDGATAARAPRPPPATRAACSTR